ncbi:hypothetical protein VPH35_130138 [Triticum aestivum]
MFGIPSSLICSFLASHIRDLSGGPADLFVRVTGDSTVLFAVLRDFASESGVARSGIARAPAQLCKIRHFDCSQSFGGQLISQNKIFVTVELRVGMSCEGCVGAVKRVLGKMEGVESFDVDIKEQKVTVKGNVTPDAVLQTVSKTGKKTSFWEAEPSASAVSS